MKEGQKKRLESRLSSFPTAVDTVVVVSTVVDVTFVTLFVTVAADASNVSDADADPPVSLLAVGFVVLADAEVIIVDE